MFIEIKEDRLNIDAIEMYHINKNNIIIFFKGKPISSRYEFSTEQEAEFMLQALDRAVGIKQLMIRKG